MAMPNSTNNTPEHASAALVVVLIVIVLGALAGRLFPRTARPVLEDTEDTTAQPR